jgi:hypothetical protein
MLTFLEPRLVVRVNGRIQKRDLDRSANSSVFDYVLVRIAVQQAVIVAGKVLEPSVRTLAIQDDWSRDIASIRRCPFRCQLLLRANEHRDAIYGLMFGKCLI